MSGPFGSIGALHQALDYHLARHNLLTANLTQVDTPGYKAQDLVRDPDSFAGVLEVQMQATNTAHFGGSVRPVDWHVAADRFAPVRPDGNSVSLDREAVKVASNNLRYDAISSMIKGSLDNLDWAARDGK
jgi:flagellar basal-body rod protein FlgB